MSSEDMTCGAAPGHPVEPSTPERWDARYRDADTPWDLGCAPPILDALVRQLSAASTGAALDVLIPGAGGGHDAVAWARAGHRVVAVDFSPRAVEAARATLAAAGVEARVVEADLFALPADMAGAFDVIWEQTCFCAIDPDRRDDYVAAAHGALRPTGQLLGLFWNHGKEGGPPWNLPPVDVRARFDPRFVVEAYDWVPKPDGGRDPEFLVRMRPRIAGASDTLGPGSVE